MPRVTALRRAGADRIEIDLDGGVWRVVPVEAAIRAGLVVGAELDRPQLRVLRRELRRSEAIGVAANALRRRDLSERMLADRLDRAGVAPAGRAEALAILVRAGVVDDERLAHARARVLAERGAGDALIRHDLAGRGVAEELLGAALAGLEPEPARAERLAAQLGGGVRAARTLARRGFAEDSIEAAVEAPIAEHP